MLTWRYLSRLTKPWQQGSWQQVDVRNDSFPAVSLSSQCLAQCGMEPCSRDTSPPSTQCGDGGSGGQLLAGPLLDYTESLQRVTCTVIMGHQAGHFTASYIHPAHQHPASRRCYILCQSVRLLVKILCISVTLTFYLKSTALFLPILRRTETTSKVCKSNTNMMLQPG